MKRQAVAAIVLATAIPASAHARPTDVNVVSSAPLVTMPNVWAWAGKVTGVGCSHVPLPAGRVWLQHATVSAGGTQGPQVSLAYRLQMDSATWALSSIFIPLPDKLANFGSHGASKPIGLLARGGGGTVEVGTAHTMQFCVHLAGSDTQETTIQLTGTLL